MHIGFLLVFIVTSLLATQSPWVPTLAAFFLIGTAGFWVSLAIFNVMILGFLENDEDFAAVLSAVAMFVIFQLFGGIDFVGHFRHNLTSLLAYGVFYMTAGTGWSFFKWFMYCRDERKLHNKKVEILNKQLAQMKEANDTTTNHVQVMGETIWLDKGKKNRRIKPKIPQASENKSRITGWMTFWPWSLLWFIINDPIRRAFRAIYDSLQGAFQKISDRAFAGADTA